MKKIISKVVIAICGIGLIASMIFMAREIMIKKELNTPVASSTVEMPSTQEVDESNKPKAPKKELNWTNLHNQNEDIYAWLSIPGTNIDYPILQHPSDDNFYLMHNLDKSYGYPGCIYTQSLNAKDFGDPNTILYGHCMKNGTMFKQLRLYEDLEFFKEHQYVYIYTQDKAYTYEVYSGVVFNDRHLLYQYNFKEEWGFNRFLEDLQSSRDMRSHIKNEIKVSPEDKLLTLSTCVTPDGPERWLVVGILRNEEKITNG